MVSEKLSFLGKLFFRWLPSFMFYVMLAATVPLVLLIFSQVWFRYFLHLPLLWVEEVATVPAFWMYMTGAAYAAYNRTHIRVDIVEIAVKNPRRRVLIRFLVSLITLGFAILFVMWGYEFFVWDIAHRPESATLRFPMVYGRSSFFFAAGILGGLYFLVESIDLARQLFWGKAPLYKMKEA